MFKGTRILIVDSDGQSRARLREALQAVVYKGQTTNARGLNDGLDILKAGEEYDYVFVSAGMGQEEVLKFLGSTLEAQLKKSPLNIVMLPPDDQDSTLVSKLYVHGAHGFVCEPFSPEKLFELMVTAQEKAREGVASGAKDESIVRFLLGDVMRLLDEVAELKLKKQKSAGYSGKSLKTVSETFRKVASSIDPDRLQEIMIHRFQEAKPFKDRVEVQREKAKQDLTATHPGAEIREILARRGLTKERILGIMRIEPADFDLILEEKFTITEETARELARALGKTANYWVGVQAKWDKVQALKQAEAKAEAE